MTDRTLEHRLQQLEDRVAIKEIVDTFSNLADVKDIAAQMYLFTENAVVETYMDGQLFARMTGRAEIAAVFSSFIANFDAMYHMNGQLLIGLNGDHATGQHYCQVALIATAGAKKTLNSNGVIYRDTYVRTADGWKISERIARFTWRNTAEMSA